MKIQYNTDKTINGDERHEDFFTSEIGRELHRFESHITRIEAHLSDQNGNKESSNDILCTLEAGIKGMQPIAVTCQADTTSKADPDNYQTESFSGYNNRTQTKSLTYQIIKALGNISCHGKGYYLVLCF
ncbi:hypothetical protein LAG90_05155 [Marinilongibacter aquaticus]|uniref:hypothetical protein n=1 Tax=Marinilongibacter aquaticus TaxID=2975157 RepID=UPI0021BDC50B|nr:hypothetical protein [Marinilongibacter aquaticus]UBM60032.1 hypothetical protein LAG90_05155 [Marinilongibacter aquaticus]